MTVSAGARTATIGVLVLALSLTGCIGGAPSATLAPDPTAAPATPIGEPTPSSNPPQPLPTVGGLVVRPHALELRAEGGTVVATLDYMSSPADAIVALTTVFGEPPVDEPYSATNHRPAGVFHRWDEFVLDERFYDEARRQAEGYDWLVWPRFAVYFDGPAADGVVLSAASGLQAGDRWIDAESDTGFDPDLRTCIGTTIEAQLASVPADSMRRDQVAVVVFPTEDGSTVKWIGAPELEGEGCA